MTDVCKSNIKMYPKFTRNYILISSISGFIRSNQIGSRLCSGQINTILFLFLIIDTNIN